MNKKSIKEMALLTVIVLMSSLLLIGCSNRRCDHHSCHGYSHHHHYGHSAYHSPAYRPHCGARHSVGYWRGGCGSRY